MNPPQICATPWDLNPHGYSRARWATSALFLVNGIGFGTWAAMIPTVKQRFDLSESGLSYVLLAIVIGALISMSIVGHVLSRHGTRAALMWIAPSYAISVALLGFAPSPSLLIASAVLFGAMKGTLDVSINSQAITVEKAGSRPIMASFQSLWSFGGLLAALIVGFSLKQGLSPLLITGIIASTLFLASIFSTGSLTKGDAVPAKKATSFQLPNSRILRIGALAFIALFTEGVMMDWSAVYTKTVAAAPEWLAPIAYGVFSLMMATGRALGDGLTAKYGTLHILRMGGLLNLIGLLIIITCPWWPATFLGLSLAGLGIANLVPVLFGAGGRAHPESVGQGVAAVSMIGYFGFLAGPPLIGFVSHQIGLPGAFATVLLLILPLIIWGPGTLQKAAPTHS